MPPGLSEDGIFVVSMSGSPLTGSGKSLTPLVAHALGELEARRLLLGAFASRSTCPAAAGPCTRRRPLPHRGAHADPVFELALARSGPGSPRRRGRACTRRTSPPCPTPAVAPLGAWRRSVAAGVARATARADQGDEGEGGRAAVSRRSPLHPRIVGRVGVHGRAAVIDGLGAQLVVPGLVAVDPAQPVRGAVRRTATRRRRRARCRPRRPTRARTSRAWPPSGRPPPPSRTSRPPRGAAAPGTPRSASRCRRRTRRRRPRHRSPPGAGRRADRRRAWRRPGPSSSKTVVPSGTAPPASPSARRARRGGRRGDRRSRPATPSRTRTPAAGRRGRGDRRDGDEQAGDAEPRRSGSGGALFVLAAL